MNDLTINVRSLAKEFNCAPPTITFALRRHLTREQITARKNAAISRSASLRQDLKSEAHRENARKASRCVKPENRKKAILKAIAASVAKRKGKPLSEEHREKLSIAHLGLMLGPRSPSWRGGTSKICWRGTGWARARKMARQRDGDTCQLCGKTKEQQGRSMDVHHIVSYFSFTDATDANRLENLICLCRSCHRKVENGQCVLIQALEAGLRVVLVNPRNTSRICSACGQIGVRRKHRFSCNSCGLVADADQNASANIARAGAVKVSSDTVTQPEVAVLKDQRQAVCFS